MWPVRVSAKGLRPSVSRARCHSTVAERALGTPRRRPVARPRDSARSPFPHSLIQRLIRRIWLPNEDTRDRWVAAEAALIVPGARVLDAGAGSAPYQALFRHCQYVSYDFCRLPPTALRGRDGYRDISCLGDMHQLPFRDGSFDVVVCTEVLEHVRRPEATVAELARVLRAGGRLLASAPLGSWEHQPPFHYFGGFTKFWWEPLLRENEFSEWTITNNGGFYQSIAQEFIRAATELAPWRGKRQLMLSPVWLVSLPLSVVLAPLTAAWMDRWFPNAGRCFGLQVTARRA